MTRIRCNIISKYNPYFSRACIRDGDVVSILETARLKAGGFLLDSEALGVNGWLELFDTAYLTPIF